MRPWVQDKHWERAPCFFGLALGLHMEIISHDPDMYESIISSSLDKLSSVLQGIVLALNEKKNPRSAAGSWQLWDLSRVTRVTIAECMDVPFVSGAWQGP